MRVPNEEDTMYTAPTDDMQFLIDDVLDVGSVLGELPQYAELGLGNEQPTAHLDERILVMACQLSFHRASHLDR